jgi:hypothetical protein
MIDRPLTFAEAQAEMLRELEARERKATTSNQTQREIDEARAIRQRARAVEAEPRKTAEELKAKYGDNWGLVTHDEHVEQRRQEIERRLSADCNRLFERECMAHGMPRDSKVSPFLWRQVQQRLADEEHEQIKPQQDMNT